MTDDRTEYIVVAQDRLGKVEDLAVCNAYSLARDYAEQFATIAPASAVITIYEGTVLAVQGGRIESDTAVAEEVSP